MKNDLVTIALAVPDDAADIALVHVRTWQAAYAGLVPADHLARLDVQRRRQMWRESIERGESQVLLARVDGEAAGWASWGPCRDDGAPAGTAELYAIYVLPSHWSRGVGRALWLEVRQRMAAGGDRRACLWVLAGNDRAIRFYEAAGFRAEPSSAQEIEIGGRPLQELRYAASLTDPAS